MPRVVPPFIPPPPGPFRGCHGDGELGLRERKKAQTRDAIINAALDLFEQQGYEGTTIEEIAAAANISPRTFFRYFDTKLEVIMESSKPEVDEISDLILARPSSESVIEAARVVFRARLVGELIGDEATGKRTARQFRIIIGTPSLFTSAQEHARVHQDSLVPVMADRLGVAPDSVVAHLAASVITTTTWTCFEHWAMHGANPEDLLDLVDEAFSALADLV